MFGWIKCSDLPPPEKQLVLCIGAKNGYFLGERWGESTFKDSLYMDVPNSRSGRYAVYWQLLPNPPEA